MSNKLKDIIDESYNSGKYEMANKVLSKIKNGDSIIDIENFLKLFIESADIQKEGNGAKKKKV